MKSKTSIFSVLCLFLAIMVFGSCEAPEEELIENENLTYENGVHGEVQGVDKDVERPGSQGGN